MAIIHTLVEGVMDEAAANRLIKETGHIPGTCCGKRGCTYIYNKVQGFNNAAVTSNYLVLVDYMDTKLTCPAEVVSRWVPHRRSSLLFRVVVRELESWLLADREALARFLGVSITKIPSNPEKIGDPKLALINIARTSRNKSIREALVPEQGSKAIVGKLYSSEMIRFIQNEWNIKNARRNSVSLNKCCLHLEEVTN